MTKRRVHDHPRKWWTAAEDRILKAKYPHVQTKKLVPLLPGRTLTTIYQHANGLGLEKSPEYLASADACRLRKGDKVGWAHRYPKGHVPANKGLRRPGWGPGRMKATQFKKDQMPHNWKPVGTTRVNSEGYRDIKITDLRRGALDWRGIHRLNWIAVHGAIPKTHFLRFRDGDRLNTLVENLELVTRAEHLRRNYHDRYPLELKQIVQLRGAIQRQINKRKGNREEQNRGLAQSPVRHAGGASGQGQAHGARPGEGNQRRGADDHQQRQGRSGLHEDARRRSKGQRLHPRGKADSSAAAGTGRAAHPGQSAKRQQVGSSAE